MIKGEKSHSPKPRKSVSNRRSTQNHTTGQIAFLIDIQQKLQEGKGQGYANWAKVFNVKQIAKTVMFLEEHGVSSFEELRGKAEYITERRDTLLDSVKVDEKKLQEITVLKTHKINYEKARKVFAEYKTSGYNQQFFEEHRELLTLRRAAKQAFDEYTDTHPEAKELPRIKDLNVQYSEILERNKRNYSEYCKLRNETRDWIVENEIMQMISKGKEIDNNRHTKNKIVI